MGGKRRRGGSGPSSAERRADARADDREDGRFRVPAWRSPPTWLLGAAALAILGLLGATGVLLALRYEPDPALAHSAVQRLKAGSLGWLRGAHAWSATVLLVLVLVHLVRAWRAAGSGGPRLRYWLTGVLAFAILLGAYHSGMVLSWDQQGWEALQHLQFALGLLGMDALDPNRPEGAPLRVIFYFHVFALPAALGASLWVHLRRPTGAGLAVRLKRYAPRTLRFVAPVVVAVAVLAVALPPLHGPAPLPGIVLSKPDWPFLWLLPLQDSLGDRALAALPLLLAVLALLPVAAGRWGRRGGTAVLTLGLGLLLALSVRGAFS